MCENWSHKTAPEKKGEGGSGEYDHILIVNQVRQPCLDKKKKKREL